MKTLSKNKQVTTFFPKTTDSRIRITMNTPFSTTGKTAYAEYGYFGVASENAKYKLSLGSYTRVNINVFFHGVLGTGHFYCLESCSDKFSILHIDIPFSEANRKCYNVLKTVYKGSHRSVRYFV